MYIINKYGSVYIAHREGHDCLADDALHGEADHPVAALRQLIKQEEQHAQGNHHRGSERRSTWTGWL